MRVGRRWIRLVSLLVPSDEREEWTEQWRGELAASGGHFGHAHGALADAWYLRTEGWTMGGLWRDVTTAVRGFARRPAFTLMAGVTLTVGIAANTAIYSVVDGVLVNPLPYPDGHELVSYNHEAPGLGVNVPVIPHSSAMYLHYLEHARELSAFTVTSNGNATLVTDDEPRQLTVSYATVGYFDVLGIQPSLGRGWVEGEDREGAEPTVVLSHGLWDRAFGSDPSVLGRLVEMDGVRMRVIGVMPSGFAVLDEDAWLPLTIREADDEGSLSYIGIGRLAPGATVESADREMRELLLRFAETHTESLPTGILEQAGLDADVKPLKEILVEDLRPVLWVLLGTVGIVLLVACANVANLFLVRAEGRVRELALRRALGASRLDVVRQHLTESITLAGLSGLVALVIASFGIKGLLALAPAQLPQALEIGIDGSVVAFTGVISLLAGVLFGMMPAVGLGNRNLSGSLRDGGRSSTGGRERLRLRSGLVVGQVALSLVLLVGSGLMLRSFIALRSVDPGFETEGRLAFSISIPTAEYDDARSVLGFQRALVERLEGSPGIVSAGLVNGLPLTGSKSASPMEPTDAPLPEGELGPLVEQRSVTPTYFTAMEIPLVAGRGLEWSDQADERRSVVVSEALASAFWPGSDAVGRMIQSQGGEAVWEVVGVAADVRFDSVEDEPLPMIYLPVVIGTSEQTGAASDLAVVVHANGDPLAAVETARAALRSVDPKIPMISPITVESIVTDSMSSTSFTVILLGIAAGVALLLGTVGMYGVIAYVVSRRTQEIGVRMALGAPAGTVLRSFVRQGLTLTGMGLGLGLIGAWLLSRTLQSLLYGVTSTDPLTFFGTAGVLALVSAVATWVPARRAARVDPVEALRSE